MGICAQFQKADEPSGQDCHLPQAVIGMADSRGRAACGADAALVGVLNFLRARISCGAGAFCVRPRLSLDLPLIIPGEALERDDWVLVRSTGATQSLCQ